MIRRASTIKGLAFTEDDFEMGPQIGSGFFGKVRKVSAHLIYEIFCLLEYIYLQSSMCLHGKSKREMC